MIIDNAEQLRDITGSYYSNSDFTRIKLITRTVEEELCQLLTRPVVDYIDQHRGEKDTEATWFAAAQAIGYMAIMRYQRLNDVSHEDTGRKVKIDRDNEARPFEWQLARDDRAHLEEYNRALDRLITNLDKIEVWRNTDRYKYTHRLIIRSADSMAFLTGVEPSPWLYLRLQPFIMESQHFVEKAYGTAFQPDNFHPFEESNTLNYAAQMAVGLGAISLMGRRTSLQALPYGLMNLFEQDGGGNRHDQSTMDQIDHYLRHLSHEQHYWINEMRTLRDLADAPSSDGGPATFLQIPENKPANKYIRL